MITVYELADFLKHSPEGRIYYDISSKRVSRGGVPDIFVKFCLYGFPDCGELICYEHITTIRWEQVDSCRNLLDGLADAEKDTYEKLKGIALQFASDNDFAIYHGRLNDGLKYEMILRLNHRIKDLEEKVQIIDICTVKTTPSDTKTEDIINGS